MGWGAAASGGLGIIGDIMSAQSQENTNLTNFQIAQMNNDFNAQQAALNRQFQTTSQGQAEAFMNMESSTAIQRRAQDLAAAGLNPQLAVGNPASSPMIGGMGGSTAQSAGNPTMQNPGAAFQNLGSLTAQALQTQSQVNLQKAQADLATEQAKKTHSETPTSRPQEGGDIEDGVTVDPMGNHLIGDALVRQINNNADLQAAEKQKVINLSANIIASTNLTNVQQQGAQIQNMIAGQDYKILVATRDALINKAIAESSTAGSQAKIAGAGASMAQKDWDIMSGKYGTAIMTINKALPAANTAISAVGAARGFGALGGVRTSQNPGWSGDTSDDWKNFHLPLQE